MEPSGRRVDGATEPVLNPATGEEIAQAPLSGAADVDARRRGGPPGLRARGRRRRRQTRATALLAIADAIEEHGEELAREEAINAGKPLRGDAQRRDRRDGRQPALLRRRRALHGGPGRRRVHGGPHLVHPPRAGRRGRPDRALELPAADGGLEDRPGARDRLHDRAQAGRDDAGHDAAARRAGRRDPARGRAQRDLRPRRRGRAAAGRAPRRRHGLADRLGRHRQADRRRGRRRRSSASTSSSAARRR